MELVFRFHPLASGNKPDLICFFLGFTIALQVHTEYARLSKEGEQLDNISFGQDSVNSICLNVCRSGYMYLFFSLSFFHSLHFIVSVYHSLSLHLLLILTFSLLSSIPPSLSPLSSSFHYLSLFFSPSTFMSGCRSFYIQYISLSIPFPSSYLSLPPSFSLPISLSFPTNYIHARLINFQLFFLLNNLFIFGGMSD